MLQCWWIYGRRDLWNMPLRWPQMAWYSIHMKLHKGRFRCSKAVRGGYTHTQTARWSHEHTFIFKNKENRIKRSMIT
jgi:hypothetical protein